MHPTAALLTAIRSQLQSDSGVRAQFTGTPPVFTTVPDTQVIPYITLAIAGSTDWDTADWYGRASLIDVHVWGETTAQAGGRAKVLAILYACEKALRDPLTLSGHANVLVRFENSRDMLEPDNRTIHGVSTFRALTQES